MYCTDTETLTFLGLSYDFVIFLCYATLLWHVRGFSRLLRMGLIVIKLIMKSVFSHTFPNVASLVPTPLMNAFTRTSSFRLSVRCWWTWRSAMWFSRAAVIVDLVYVFSLLNAENERSAVALDAGMVNTNRTSLQTSENIELAWPRDKSLLTISSILVASVHEDDKTDSWTRNLFSSRSSPKWSITVWNSCPNSQFPLKTCSNTASAHIYTWNDAWRKRLVTHSAQKKRTVLGNTAKFTFCTLVCAVGAVIMASEPDKSAGSSTIGGPRTWKSGGSIDPLDPVAPRPVRVGPMV